jgi:hypothetical protein
MSWTGADVRPRNRAAGPADDHGGSFGRSTGSQGSIGGKYGKAWGEITRVSGESTVGMRW